MVDEKTSPLRLLVVDDEPLIRWFLANGLSTAGYEVVAVDSGREAVFAFGEGDQVDLVLLDLKLPDSDGLRILKELKTKDPSCPVILMTAHGTDETREESMEAGAFEMITKPFGMDDMLNLVRRAFE
jgi:DNA-binding NtrC family response regulator